MQWFKVSHLSGGRWFDWCGGDKLFVVGVVEQSRDAKKKVHNNDHFDFS